MKRPRPDDTNSFTPISSTDSEDEAEYKSDLEIKFDTDALADDIQRLLYCLKPIFLQADFDSEALDDDLFSHRDAIADIFYLVNEKMRSTFPYTNLSFITDRDFQDFCVLVTSVASSKTDSDYIRIFNQLHIVQSALADEIEIEDIVSFYQVYSTFAAAPFIPFNSLAEFFQDNRFLHAKYHHLNTEFLKCFPTDAHRYTFQAIVIAVASFELSVRTSSRDNSVSKRLTLFLNRNPPILDFLIRHYYALERIAENYIEYVESTVVVDPLDILLNDKLQLEFIYFSFGPGRFLFRNTEPNALVDKTKTFIADFDRRIAATSPEGLAFNRMLKTTERQRTVLFKRILTIYPLVKIFFREKAKLIAKLSAVQESEQNHSNRLKPEQNTSSAAVPRLFKVSRCALEQSIPGDSKENYLVAVEPIGFTPK